MKAVCVRAAPGSGASSVTAVSACSGPARARGHRGAGAAGEALPGAVQWPEGALE